jgi:DNA modification methylase
MTNAKFVIETSASQKDALYEVLKERGTTLTEWFNDKVAEIIAPYNFTFEDQLLEIHSCQDLEDPETVLTRISEQDWALTNANTVYLSHNIHPYPAKFIPQIPRYLIKMLSLRGETVWDPFGGSGTTALEALLLGRQAISSDINPVATLIGQAKTITLTLEEENIITHFIEKIELLASNSISISDTFARHEVEIKLSTPEIPNCEKWFHPNVLSELGYIRWRINNIENPNCKILAQVALSKIIIKASFQDGETRYASKVREVEVGSILRMFASELNSALGKVRHLSTLLRFRTAKFQTADLRVDNVVPANSIDLIVTSPPYPNATDYHLYHRFRLFWLGHDPRLLAKSEIGSHLRHQKEGTGIEHYLEEMQICLEKMYRGLRLGRYAVIVLGAALFKGVYYQTAELVAEVAKKIGFEVVGIVSREVHARKRSFISPARRLKEEKLLVLRKPLRQITFTLLKPPYRLWPYEDVIRQLEIENSLGIEIGNTIMNGSIVSINPLKVDRLRRLTFTYGFWAAEYDSESTWQATLENGDVFETQPKRKDPKYATHGLHPYKGKFYPQLAKSLFNLAQLEPQQKILDPFCGSGTVLLEGYLNGLDAKGFDINPLAAKIARVKTKILTLDLYLVDRLLSQFIRQLEQIDTNESNKKIFNEACIEELESWFPELVLRKLGWIFRAIDDVPEPTVHDFLEVCLSSIVREISQQEPKDLRIRRRKNPLEDAPVKDLYEKKLCEQRERLRHFAQRTNQAPAEFGAGKAFLADCREFKAFRQAHIGLQSIDAVVTSPPYATALPYIDTDRLSILLLFGLRSRARSVIEYNLIGSREILPKDRTELDEKIEAKNFGNIISPTAQKTISEIYNLNKNANVGFRRKNSAALLYRYYSDMTNVLSNLSQVVAPNGSLFFVIGDNKTQAGEQEIIIQSGQFIKECGIEFGWRLIDMIPITVTQENRLHNKNSITNNDIIWFKKP